MKEVLGREIRRVPTLRGTTVVTLFYEASTRTRSSFELAARSWAPTSSASPPAAAAPKGRVAGGHRAHPPAVGADMLVMRHRRSGAPYLVARHVNMSVVNAGDGWHAHPSQGLLDAYTSIATWATCAVGRWSSSGISPTAAWHAPTSGA